MNQGNIWNKWDWTFKLKMLLLDFSRTFKVCTQKKCLECIGWLFPKRQILYCIFIVLIYKNILVFIINMNIEHTWWCPSLLQFKAAKCEIKLNHAACFSSFKIDECLLMKIKINSYLDKGLGSIWSTSFRLLCDKSNLNIVQDTSCSFHSWQVGTGRRIYCVKF